MILINCKTYNQASGKNAEELAKISKDMNAPVILCTQASDIHRCSEHNRVFAQHVDTEPAGGHTGKVTIKSLVENGATGCLVNHSENRIPTEQIEATISLLKEHNITSVLCVQDSQEAQAYAQLSPDYIAIEPPELIGGDVSVTSANPAIVSDSVQAVQAVNEKVKVLCGAGVKNGSDVAKAKELGAVGVLIASGVAKAEDKKAALLDLVSGL